MHTLFEYEFFFIRYFDWGHMDLVTFNTFRAIFQYKYMAKQMAYRLIFKADIYPLH